VKAGKYVGQKAHTSILRRQLEHRVEHPGPEPALVQAIRRTLRKQLGVVPAARAQA
jgi:hypothetical protein